MLHMFTTRALPARRLGARSRRLPGWGMACAWIGAMCAACGPPRPIEGPIERPIEQPIVDLNVPMIPYEALSALVDTLLAGTAEARRLAADSLDRLADARTPAILLDRLHDPATRFEASHVLSRISLASGLDSLLHGLADTSAFVRWSVATTLGAQGAASAGSLLVHLLDDMEMPVRRAAARSLGQLADTSYLPALLDHQHDRDEEVRAAIAEALGQFGPATVPFLRGMVEQDSGLAVTASLRSLGRVGSREVVPVVGVALLDGPVPTRMAAAEALGQLAGSEADSFLVAAALDDPEPLVREWAVRALAQSSPALVLTIYAARRLREQDAFVRASWVDALDRVPGEEARDALLRLSEEDVSPDVRNAARRALFFRSQDAVGGHR